MVLNPQAVLVLEPDTTVYIPEDIDSEYSASHIAAKEFFIVPENDITDEYDISGDAYEVNIGDVTVLVPTKQIKSIVTFQPHDSNN